MPQSRRRGVAKWAPGDTAWVEFDAGTYRCELVSLRYGYWAVKWANGDTDHTKVDEKKLLREAPTKRAKTEAECFVCAALGRTNLDKSQLMCYTIGGVRRHIDLCCALRALTPDVPKQEWWGNLERNGAWPTCPENRVCSTDPCFEPYAVTKSDLRDEFVYRDVLKARAAAQRFAGRAPPYDCHRSSASLWRDQDRGTINGMRALRELAAAAESEGLSRGEIILWGAVVYRLINRVSTFSRWAAVCYLREKHDEE